MPTIHINVISIHAAREGGDVYLFYYIVLSYRFQSTPPVKAATVKSQIIPQIIVFQSTPPVKAATFNPLNDVDYTEISIHAAREGGDLLPHTIYQYMNISIHAAREGGDAAILR